MGAEITISSKGQIVIPKDVRDRLNWLPGQKLTVSESGGAVVLRPPSPDRTRISYDEFRRRVPRYDGPPVSVEDMHRSIEEIFRDWTN